MPLEKQITELVDEGISPVQGVTLKKTKGLAKQVIWFCRWSRDGRYLAYISDENIIIYDFSNGQSRIVKTEGKPRYIDWSDSNLLGYIDHNGNLFILNSSLERKLTQLKGFQRFKFSPDGKLLLVQTIGGVLRIIDWAQRSLIRDLGEFATIFDIHWSIRQLFVVCEDGYLYFYDTENFHLYRTFQVNATSTACHGNMLAAANGKNFLVKDLLSGAEIIVEAHTGGISGLCYSRDGRLLVSKSHDQSIKIWRCSDWKLLAVIDESNESGNFGFEINFNPLYPCLLTRANFDKSIRLWDIDFDSLLSTVSEVQIVRYTTAKIVLIGDSGVGKTGLGWRLANDTFKEHASTHGQQFWSVKGLGLTRQDGTLCEAVLWDLAGQPDYRIVHSIFLDKVDLALVVFDPTRRQDSLNAALFWLNQLKKKGKNICPLILVAGRSDTGTTTLTDAELKSFCEHNGISGGFISTSAKNGSGITQLIEKIMNLIPWSSLNITITSGTFKSIKDYILSIKENTLDNKILVTLQVLKQDIESANKELTFSDNEMFASIQNLENHGFVSILHDSKGAQYVLLKPDVLTNLASSYVLEARRNVMGLGVLEESKLLAGGYSFPELAGINSSEREILQEATTTLFLEHAICFRELFNGESLLVFPSLINEKKPLIQEISTKEDVSYVIKGPIENVYASLVVLLGYTNTFVRNNQWKNQAQYQVAEGEICGFRQISDKEGELELILYYSLNVPIHLKSLFQGLVERFLYNRELNISRYTPVVCGSCGDSLERNVMIQKLSCGRNYCFCSSCGGRLDLPDSQVNFSQTKSSRLEEEQSIARNRTTFEAVLVRFKTMIRDQQNVQQPNCFISYAWGIEENETWALRFANDLRKADINVLLDKWHNPPGTKISKYIEEIHRTDFIVVIGTEQLKIKYDSDTIDAVVSAEMSLISSRLMKPKKYGDKVIPVLLEGTQELSFPSMLQDIVYLDFCDERKYFSQLFSLVWQLYQLPFDNPSFQDFLISLKPVHQFETSSVYPASNRF